MSDHRLYCYPCERFTPHSDYGSREVVAECDVCEMLRYLPDDNDESQCSDADEQTSIVQTGTAGKEDS